MTSRASGASSAPALPDYAPVPRLALGPALNDQGYYVGRVERNLYWVTDGDYHSAFLTTRDGVVLFDAPPSIGQNLQRAVNDIAAAEGVSNTVTHLVYTHHHADHAGASSLFGSNVARIGHEETRGLLLRDNDPAKPAPEETSSTTAPWRSAVNASSWRGTALTTRRTTPTSTSRITTPSCSSTSCSPAGCPSTASTSAKTCPATWTPRPRRCPTTGSTSSSATWARLGTRDDVTVHQQYIADIEADARTALATVDPTPYFQKYGENLWAAVRGYLDAVADAAAAPVIKKYTGVLGAVDVFTVPTAFSILESIRLDLGYRMDVHP